MSEEGLPSGKPPGPRGRRYDLAASKLGLATPPNEPSAATKTDAPRAPQREPAEPPASDEAWRIKTVPKVRPGVTHHRKPAPTVADEVLQTAAESAFIGTDAQGDTWFEITMNDELFSNLSCRIAMTDGAITATFVAPDPNVRRLIEAESGRLRNMLEAKGMRVADVRVVVEGPTWGDSEPDY